MGQPICEMVFDALLSIRRNLPDCTKKYVAFHNRKATNSNDALLLQSTTRKVRITCPGNFVKSRNIVMQLRRNHAQEPIFVCTRDLAK